MIKINNIFIYIIIMATLKTINFDIFSKNVELKQEEKTYRIELSINSNNILSIFIKDTNTIDEYYKLEITFEAIQNKNATFRMYKNLEAFIILIEQIILNKNASIKENNNSLILDLFIFNIINGNKEKISFELNKIENINKDEIIKSLCLKMNNLEEKYNKLNEKYEILEQKYEKIMTVVGPMIKKEEDYKFDFQWENHSNCQLTNNNKILRKIKNDGWNTNVKGNKILRKNSINIFKIRVNNIHKDKSGLAFGIAKISSDFSDEYLYEKEWNINCYYTNYYNTKFLSFEHHQINEGDIVTFIVDLINGTLSVKKK